MNSVDTVWWSVLSGQPPTTTTKSKRRHSFTVATTHTTVKRTFSHTLTIFTTWLNTVYFLICLILWCNCSVLLWLVYSGGGVGDFLFFFFFSFFLVDLRVGQRRFSISATVTFSVFPLPLSWRAELSRLNNLKMQFFCLFVCFVGTDHKHIPDYSLSVLSFYPDSFLLRQDNMCLILSDSHVYKSAYMCTHVQYTLFEQSITVTIIDDYTCPFFELSVRFFLLFPSCPDFLLMNCVCESLKREGDSCDFFTLSFISGFVDILLKPFFISLTVMLWRWS